jgi:hypothetical protein
MYVATNRQKAPENGFQKRARLKREAEEERAEARAAKVDPVGPPPYPPRPTPPPIPGVDLEAMKAAAAEAAALIAPKVEPEPEAEEPAKRGRKPSDAVKERGNAILRYLGENPEGLSKPQLAEKLGEKEANVYTSLNKLQGAGKVRNVKTETGGYRWFLV